LLFAKGQPVTKTREMDGQMPFEEWIYGKPPQDVDFVRINGNRVIRVEIAKVGEPVQVFTKDEVDGLMRSDGTPVVASANTRTVEAGDVEKDPNRQAPDAPPSLRGSGESLPDDQNKNTGVMRPVQPAKPHTDDAPWNNPDEQQPAAQPAGSTTQPAASPSSQPAQPASSGGGQSSPSASQFSTAISLMQP